MARGGSILLAGVSRGGAIVDRIVGIIAGSFGLVSIFLPWVAIPGFGINLIQVLDLTNLLRQYGFDPTVQVGEVSVTAVALLTACLVLLILGSIISFFRPVGGIFILLSWLGFAIGFYVMVPQLARLIVGFGAGFFLAVTASIVSLARYALRPYLVGRPYATPTAQPMGQFLNPPPPPG